MATRAHDPSGPAERRAPLRRARPMAAMLGAALLMAGCTLSGMSGGSRADPPHSEAPVPDYTAVCAPRGADSAGVCLRLTLQAVDDARASEGLAPMVLPSDYPDLTVPEQLFIAVDRERVDRGLAPFVELNSSLDANAGDGAHRATLPPPPDRAFTSVASEWIGAVDNGLDADYQWMYDDGPGSGVPGCSHGHTSGCWGDRAIVLGQLGSGRPVMGAAFDPAADTSRGDHGGSSLAAVLAVGPAPGATYTWRDALEATAVGKLQPLRGVPASDSSSGVPNPDRNIAAVPDFTRVCAPQGLDDSATCTGAALAAINRAHREEGIRPMVLPIDFAQLSAAEQLFVTIDLERVDRGLAPFSALTAALDRDAQRGAVAAGDPPDPGRAYLLDDTEWAGGSSNGLDAVYGWMYDDGYQSGNLDCPHPRAPGCWGHRKGILDDFGSGPDLVMGAAVDGTGDTHRGDTGGTCMAVTLAVADAPAQSVVLSWARVLAAMPGGAP